MTTAPKPGDQLHWQESGVTYQVSEVGTGTAAISQRSQTFTVTKELLDANRDRLNFSIFDLADDEDEQLRRFGKVILGTGEAPADMRSWTPGSVEHNDARDEARRLAWLLDDPRERQAALAEAARIYGQPPSGQQSSYSPDDAERDAELRRAGLR